MRKTTKRKHSLSFRKYPPNQLERVDEFLRSWMDKKGHQPSQAEVARRFKCNPTTVAYWYRLMVENGMMIRTPGARRVFKLLQKPQESQQVVEDIL